jgi:hypothetical protein
LKVNDVMRRVGMKAAGQLYNTAKGRQGRSSEFTVQVCRRDTCELQILYSRGTPRFDESKYTGRFGRPPTS